MNTESKKIINRLRILKVRKDKIKAEQQHLQQELVKICDHSSFTEHDRYESGSYLDREVFHKWKVCKICGVTFDIEAKKGGYG